MDNFAEWLLTQMQERGLTQAELARSSGLNQSSVSLVLSGGRRPGPDLCRAIARGMRVPASVVFKAANLLPPDKRSSPLVEEAIHILEHLEGEDVADALRYLNAPRSGRNEREKCHIGS